MYNKIVKGSNILIVMREAKLYTFASGDYDAFMCYEFFSKDALNTDYSPFLSYISSLVGKEIYENLEEEFYIDELIYYSSEYINNKINKDKNIKHGDIFWHPAWKSPGWVSSRTNGIHHVIEDELGIKHLYGGIYTEGMPVGEPRDYPGVTYNKVYQDINELTGFRKSFENAWYKWYHKN